MFEANLYLAQESSARCGFGRHEYEARAVCTALALYRRAHTRGWLGKMWSALTGCSRRLLDLTTVKATCAVRNRHYAGIQTVPLRQVRGSEGRCNDFDDAFHPLQTHNRGRWLGIATAWRLGVTLPPVELIQVGDIYFVRDGHHRISVAQALGQKYIDAEVTVWRVSGPLSWERPVAVRALSCQPA
jgi:hypothetical protein